MRIEHSHEIMRARIDPGEYFASSNPVIISTLLGSCVSACLYDPVNQVIGMNHFLLANRRYALNIPVLDSEAGRYGIHAMELLINEMMKQGAIRTNLKAKVFGGGNVLGSHQAGQDKFFYVGGANSRFVCEFLRNEKIPIIASDLGKDYGRIVHFTSTDYSAYIKKISHTRNEGVVKSERKFWKQSMDNHDSKEIQFW